MLTNTRDLNKQKSPQALDSATIDFLDAFSQMFASMQDLSIPEQRAKIKSMFHIPENLLEPIQSVKDKVIFGRHGPLKLRFFSPKKEGFLPVIIYFHRGGWVYGSIEESEMICRRLANATQSIVVAVEYHLAPEYPFPIPLEDCYDATQWIVKNAATFLGNSRQVILCGESAGGNLAAATALMIRHTKQFTVAGQLLIYPVLTNDLNPQFYEESPDKSLLSYENMQFFWNAYLTSPQEGKNPYASPLKSASFAELPPCFIITAEHDALKHEGAFYAKALQDAGVKVQTQCYPAVIHGFLDLPLAESIKNQAIEDIAAWLNSLRHSS